MKRTLALILAAVLAVTIASCGRDGNTPAPVSTQGTSGKSDTLRHTSQTDVATQKPVPPVHPAVAEVNRAVDRTLSADECRFTQSVTLSLDGGVRGSSETIHISGANTLSPSVAILNIRNPDYPYYPENIYFKDGYYYVSEFDVMAKIPENGGFDIDRYMVLRPLVMRKINGVIPTDKVYAGYDSYTYLLDSETTNAVFAEFIDSFDGTVSVEDRTVSGIIKGGESSVTVHVSNSGKVSYYSLNMEFKVYDSADSSKTPMRGVVNVSIKYDSYIPAGGVQIPENGNGYVELERYGDISELIFGSAVAELLATDAYSLSSEALLTVRGISGLLRMFEISSQRRWDSRGKGSPIWCETTVIRGDAADISSEVFCADNVCYENRGGVKTRFPDYDYIGLYSQSIDTDIDGDDIIYSAFSRTEAGKSLEISVSGSGFYEKFEKRVTCAAAIMAGGNRVTGITVKKADLSAQISNEGYISSMVLEYDMEIIFEVDGSKFAIMGTVYETVSAQRIDGNAEITPPSDLESYARV